MSLKSDEFGTYVGMKEEVDIKIEVDDAVAVHDRHHRLYIFAI